MRERKNLDSEKSVSFVFVLHSGPLSTQAIVFFRELEDKCLHTEQVERFLGGIEAVAPLKIKRDREVQV